MKTKQRIAHFFLLLPVFAGLSACSFGNTTPQKVIEDLKVGEISEAHKYENHKYFDFREFQPVRLLNVTTGYSNNNGFGSTWDSTCVNYNPNDGMSLQVCTTEDESKIKSESGDPYLSGEIRTGIYYQYGYFGAYMKPANAVGTASTFFLYNGNPHDEIDIEFLGKDTTKVQFNYFKNGKGGHEYWYDLGFDASKDFHHYGIYWGRNEITWYIDFQPVYRLVGEDTPTAKCQLFANMWAGASNNEGIMGWMGEANPLELPAYTYYQRWDLSDEYGNEVTVRPKGKEYDVCPGEDVLTNKPVVYKSKSAYSIVDTTSTTQFEISYSREDIYKNYLNICTTVEGIENNKFIQTTVKNLKDHPLLMRINVEKVNISGSSEALSFLDLWKNGEKSSQAKINNSTEAIFEIDANEEAVVTARWYGANASIVRWMFDDFGDMKVIDGVGQRDGHLIISNFKFGGVQDYTAEDDSDDVTELYTPNGITEDPESEQAQIPSDYSKVDINFNSNTWYNVTKNGEETEISYDVPDANYNAISSSGSLGLDNVTRVILVLKNNNKKEEYFIFRLRDENKAGTVESVKILSSSSTGRFDRFSSSNPGMPYVYVCGQRTCQIEFILKGTVNIAEFGFIAAVGQTAIKGSCTIKGIYKK